MEFKEIWKSIKSRIRKKEKYTGFQFDVGLIVDTSDRINVDPKFMRAYGEVVLQTLGITLAGDASSAELSRQMKIRVTDGSPSKIEMIADLDSSANSVLIRLPKKDHQPKGNFNPSLAQTMAANALVLELQARANSYLTADQIQYYQQLATEVSGNIIKEVAEKASIKVQLLEKYPEARAYSFPKGLIKQ